MTPALKFPALILLLVLLTYTSCKREYSCENCITHNQPPIAVAGKDTVIILPVDSVYLDGSASTDDNEIVRFQWTKISGPDTFNIVQPTIAATIVNQLVKGVFQFELKVTDAEGTFSKDTVEITLIAASPGNHPPVAYAGKDTIIKLPNNVIDLDGSGSTDLDNNISSYQWTKLSGPSSFTIVDANAEQTKVTDLVQGNYVFELKVTDAGGLFSKDSLHIRVNAASLSNCDVGGRPLINAQLSQIGTLSEARAAPAVAGAGDKIVFAGGLKDWICGPDYGIASSAVDIFDINTHSQSTAHLSVARWGMGVVACGTKLFFAGGENGQSTAYDVVDIYDLSTNTWEVAHLSEPRAFVAAAALGNKVFFAGGYNYPVPVKNSSKVDIYDLSTNSWSTASLSVPRSAIHATTLGSVIYFAGGDPGSTDIDLYDSSSNAWSISAFQYLQGIVSGVAVGNSFYWAGGVQAGQMYSSAAEIKNMTNFTTQTNCLSGFRYNTVSKNNNVAFLSDGNEFDVYNTATGVWAIGQIGQMSIEVGAGIAGFKNTIYIGGGGVSECPFTGSDKVYILDW
ncbi:MAG TPA: kelch repeat-containing protein [Agriterribacter sp.]|nr:kelch repeat-containing protein [Agriterribacter sp.]